MLNTTVLPVTFLVPDVQHPTPVQRAATMLQYFPVSRCLRTVLVTVLLTIGLAFDLNLLTSISAVEEVLVSTPPTPSRRDEQAERLLLTDRLLLTLTKTDWNMGSLEILDVGMRNLYRNTHRMTFAAPR